MFDRGEVKLICCVNICPSIPFQTGLQSSTVHFNLSSYSPNQWGKITICTVQYLAVLLFNYLNWKNTFYFLLCYIFLTVFSRLIFHATVFHILPFQWKPCVSKSGDSWIRFFFSGGNAAYSEIANNISKYMSSWVILWYFFLWLFSVSLWVFVPCDSLMSPCGFVLSLCGCFVSPCGFFSARPLFFVICYFFHAVERVSSLVLPLDSLVEVVTLKVCRGKFFGRISLTL